MWFYLKWGHQLFVSEAYTDHTVESVIHCLLCFFLFLLICFVVIAYNVFAYDIGVFFIHQTTYKVFIWSDKNTEKIQLSLSLSQSDLEMRSVIKTGVNQENSVGGIILHSFKGLTQTMPEEKLLFLKLKMLIISPEYKLQRLFGVVLFPYRTAFCQGTRLIL